MQRTDLRLVEQASPGSAAWLLLSVTVNAPDHVIGRQAKAPFFRCLAGTR